MKFDKTRLPGMIVATPKVFESLTIGLLDRLIPVLPITTEQYPMPARRPSYSVLDKTASEYNAGTLAS
jgi:dTDP-4-dehydrorhamnose reductase